MYGSEDLQCFRGKEVRWIEIQITNLPSFEAATTGVRAIHENLTQHDFQAADRTNISYSSRTMERKFVAVHLWRKEDGRLLLFGNLKWRGAEATDSRTSTACAFSVLVARKFSSKR